MNSTQFSENTLCHAMTGTAPKGQIRNYPCINTTTGRYLSIQRFPPYGTDKNLQLCEVQVIPAGKHSNSSPGV